MKEKSPIEKKAQEKQTDLLSKALRGCFITTVKNTH